MINYIKMDLFRLFRSISFYVCMGILMLLVISQIADARKIEKRGEKYFTSEETLQEDEDDDTITIGMTSDGEEIIRNGIDLSSCFGSVYSGSVFTFMMLILFTIFVCSEYSSGYIKNTITIPHHRWYFNISKLVTGFVIIIMENIMVIGMYLFALKFIFDNGRIGDLSVFVKYFGVQIFLSLGLCAFVIMVCDFFRSNTISIIIAIAASIQLLTAPVYYVLCGMFGMKYLTVSKFFVSTMTRMLPLNIDNRLLIEVLALGILATIVYTFFSNIIIRKKDI